MHAWVGLGSNLGDGVETITAALQCLSDINRTRLVKTSAFYRSAPWGVEDQPDFINVVTELQTKLPPEEMLSALLATENFLGRERSGKRWGPRIIDLDLLAMDDIVMSSPELTLPHPRMHFRAFVLVPLLEINPDFVIPGHGPAQECLRSLPKQRVELFS